MSYILDALKKAERERRVAKVPTLDTVHGAPWDRRRLPWMWIGIAVALLNATLVLAWFLRPERVPETPRIVTAPAPPAPTATDMSRTSAPRTVEPPAPAPPAPTASDTPPTSAPHPVEPHAPAAAVAPTATPKPGPPLPQGSASSRQAPETTPTPAEARPPAAATPSSSAIEAAKPPAASVPGRPAPAPAEQTMATIPAPSVPPAAVPAKPAGPPAVVSATNPAERKAAPAQGLPAELTPAEQQGMPKITLQFLVYSDVPGERLVFINNQKYVEGQMIEGKVVVEGIVPDGAILSYQGKRFKLHQ